ncbi:MAG: two-component regulator propeller domain-containing protein [Bacteroidota bacterium]
MEKRIWKFNIIIYIITVQVKFLKFVLLTPCIILFLLFFQFNLNAQPREVNFEHLSGKEGLSQGYITSIVQDSLGFIWVGTQDGLNKYDGYKFTVFTHSETDSNTISDNWVKSVVIDKDQNIWVGTGGKGVTKLSYDGKKNVRYPFNVVDSSGLCHGFISEMMIDSDDLIWFATWGGGLCKYDPEANFFTHYNKNDNYENAISDNEISTLYEDSKGYIWLGTFKSGIDRFNKKTREVINYKHDENDPTSLCFNWVTAISEDNKGNLWIGTYGGGLDRFNFISEEFYHYNISNFEVHGFKDSLITKIFKDSDNNLWIGTDGGGVYIYDEELDYFDNFPMDPTDPSTLNDNRIWSITEDNSGIIWIGGFSGGLNKYDKSKNWFKHYRSNPYNPNSLRDNFVKAIIVDKYNKLWVGHDQGITIIDRGKNEYKHFCMEDGEGCLKNNKIRALLEDIDGSIWIGTWGGGIAKYDPVTEKYKHYTSNPDDDFALSEKYIRDIYLDSKDQVWICTSRGLNKFIRETDQFEVYLNDPNNPESLCDNQLYVIIEDTYGDYWIGTRNGLCRLNPTTNKFETFVHHHVNDRIRSIYQDSNGQLWIGTFGGGLNLFNYKTKEFTSYTIDDGLANNVVYEIVEDNRSLLWLSTNKGLSLLDAKTMTFKNYTISDGLQSNEFNGGASFKSKEGELFFGGVNGMNSFFFTRENISVPSIVITEFKILNDIITPGSHPEILIDDINNLNEIQLNHIQDYISFEFAALQYTAPSKNEFKYILEEFENEWNYVDASKRYATYTNLDPGEYTFKIIGSNNDGVWNEKGVSLSIIITPPWWETDLAYTAYALIIISLFVGFWRFQLNRLKLKHDFEIERVQAEKYHEINKIKSRFFANISHEFRTPLTLILGPLENVLNKTDDRETRSELNVIQKSAKRLNDLINQLLDLAKMEAKSLKLKASNDNFIPFIKGLVMSYKSLADKKKISLEFNSEIETINVYFDKEVITKVIVNLLSNAFKFINENGTIKVNVKESNDDKALEILVSDTGIGIPDDELGKVFDRFYQVDESHTMKRKGTGIGLSIAKEMIEMHHGNILVESEINKGTTFKVFLPLGKDHFKPDEIVEMVQDNSEEVNEVIDEVILSNEGVDAEGKYQYQTSKKDKPILMIVEDNEDIRNYVKGYLMKEYNIIEAKNGNEGWNLSLKHMPDLIISDVMMPKMDGFQLCNKLKSDERTSHIPVILLTAKATDEDKLSGLEKGADAYLMKPFDVKELLIRIKALIEQRKKIREHFIDNGFFSYDNEDVTSIDKMFLKKAVKIIEDHIADHEFNNIVLANELAISRAQLYRKLDSLIGESPNKLILRIRMDRAVKLIKQNFGNVSEVALEVGFNNPAYFSKCFQNQFGKKPSEY